MRNALFGIVAIGLMSLGSSLHGDDGVSSENSQPIRVLLIAGGCCHDYAKQTATLKAGIEERINAEVTIVLNPSTSKSTRFELYNTNRWAEGYDVVLHDECAAQVTDKAYVDRILAEHRRGLPAVNLHCAMHCYRWGNFREPVADGADNAGWFEFVGIQSSGHGPVAPIDVSYATTEHEAADGLQNWTTTIDELYNNVKVFDGVRPVAMGQQLTPPTKQQLEKTPDAEAKLNTSVVAWTHTYGPNDARVFSVTLGHFDEVVADPNYLDLVANGIVWAAGNAE